jgi:ribosomal protein S18 acetylase RimI-like enzyme
LIIRPASQGDDLTAIWREVYESDHMPLLPRGVHAPFQPRGSPFVAEVAGSAVGFCYVDQDCLDELWVRKTWQSRGIGTGLVHYAEALMRDSGIGKASLSVLRANTRAIALYRRLGWMELRYFVSNINGETYLRMTKQL